MIITTVYSRLSYMISFYMISTVKNAAIYHTSGIPGTLLGHTLGIAGTPLGILDHTSGIPGILLGILVWDSISWPRFTSEGKSFWIPPSKLNPRRFRCSSFSSRLKPMRSFLDTIPTTLLAISTTVKCLRPRVRKTIYVLCSEKCSSIWGADLLI